MAPTSSGMCSRGKNFIKVIDTARRVKGIVKAGAILKDDKKTNAVRDLDDETTTKEDELLELVVNGDIIKIKLLFSKEEDIPDMYIRDLAGRTPFDLSVDAGNEEIACLILEKYNRNDVKDKALIKRVLMGAISRDQELIALKIVKQERYNQLFPPTTEHMDGPLKADMFQNMDPIMLASQMNHFNLVEFLCSRGDRIPPPHPPSCQCEEVCKRLYEQDQLLFEKLRLEKYRGLSSAAYVSLAYPADPIGEAFSLGKKLREMASTEKHFKKEYTELANNLSEYVYHLLDLIETNHELDMVLNKSDDAESGQLQRIKLAVENGEQNFVAHPCCQQKLTEVWYTRDLRTLSDGWRLWLVGVLYLFFSPFIGLYYVLRPKSKLAGYISTPVLRFISSVVWFLYFFIIIAMMAYHTYIIDSASNTYSKQATDTSSALNKYLKSKNFPTDKGTREEMWGAMILAGLILCWLVGMIWTQVKSIYKLGIKLYSSDPFNVMESVVIMLYLTAIVLMIDTQRNLRKKQALVIEEWSYNTQYDETDVNQLLAKEYWYWVIPDRHYWNNDDPILVVDALFAVASVLAICKIFYFMAASSIFGPLLVALRKILRDVLKFFIFLVIIFMAFMMALQSLFSYFSENNRRSVEAVAPDNNNPVSATKYFGSVVSSIKTMFWAMFALGDSQAVNIEDGSNPYTNHSFTQGVAYLIFSIYHFVIFFVMLNLFIAIMNETYDEVMKYNDREWKFVRAKLYLDFLTGGTQPSPLNWIPSLKAWFYCCTNRYTTVHYEPPKACLGTCSYPGNNRVEPGLDTSETSVEDLDPSKRKGDSSYEEVMNDLIQRYRKSNITKPEDTAVDDMEEIKRNIVNVRRQLEQRIMENKDMAMEATKVSNTQGLSLRELHNRLLPVEKKLQDIRNTLNDFITMLKRFKELKDEMAALEEKLKYNDEEPESEEKEKKDDYKRTENASKADKQIKKARNEGFDYTKEQTSVQFMREKTMATEDNPNYIGDLQGTMAKCALQAVVEENTDPSIPPKDRSRRPSSWSRTSRRRRSSQGRRKSIRDSKQPKEAEQSTAGDAQPPDRRKLERKHSRRKSTRDSGKQDGLLTPTEQPTQADLTSARDLQTNEASGEKPAESVDIPVKLAESADIPVKPEESADIPTESANIPVTPAENADIPVTLAESADIPAESAGIPVKPAESADILDESADIPVTPAESADIPAESADIPVTPAESADIPAESADIPVKPAESADILDESADIPVTPAESADILDESADIPVTPAESADIPVTPAESADIPAESANKPAESADILVLEDLESEDNQSDVAHTESPVNTNVTEEPRKAELTEGPMTGNQSDVAHTESPVNTNVTEEPRKAELTEGPTTGNQSDVDHTESPAAAEEPSKAELPERPNMGDPSKAELPERPNTGDPSKAELPERPNTGDPSKAELPERPKTGDVRRKLTSTPSMYEGIPLPPAASEPGDAKISMEAIAAQEEQKAGDGMEVPPDYSEYSLPDDDLPLPSPGDVY